MTSNTVTTVDASKWFLRDDTVTKKILAIKDKNPSASYRAIGKELGISYEYARLVCKFYDVPNTWLAKGATVLCERCDKPLEKYAKHVLNLQICIECHKVDRWYMIHINLQCPACSAWYWILKSDRRVKIASPNAPYCSRRCSAIGRWRSDSGFR